MNLQSLVNSPRAGETALHVSRIVPPGFGIRLANFVADRLAARRDLLLRQAIQANQWVISGGTLSGEALDGAVRGTLRHTAQSYYRLFHYLEDLEALQGLVDYSPQAEQVIERSRRGEEGQIVGGLHMGNFDLVMQAAIYHGLRAVGLSLPQPTEAVEWQHNLRRRTGLEILPASVANFRQVIHRLQAGETVLTGVDRPIEGSRHRPRFFGHPSHVPVHYVNMALKANVPVVVMASIWGEDGKYHIHSSDYIYMERDADRDTEILRNAERVLEIAAGFIRQAPEQWTVFEPAWPDLTRRNSYQ